MTAQIGYKQYKNVEIAKDSEPRIELARSLASSIPTDARLLTLDDDSPLILYYAHCKGWIEKQKIDTLKSALESGFRLYVSGNERAIDSFLNSSAYDFDCQIIQPPFCHWGKTGELSAIKMFKLP